MQEAGYEEALKCDGTDLDGQQLRVQKCMSAGQHVGKKKQAPAAITDAASPAVQQQSPAPKVIFPADFVLPAFAGKDRLSALIELQILRLFQLNMHCRQFFGSSVWQATSH